MAKCICPSGPFRVRYGGPTPKSSYPSSPTPWTLMSWHASEYMKLARQYWMEGDSDKARDTFGNAMWYEQEWSKGTCGSCQGVTRAEVKAGPTLPANLAAASAKVKELRKAEDLAYRNGGYGCGHPHMEF